MKLFFIVIIIATLFSSCLKDSIADAMLNEANPGRNDRITATLSYQANGDPITIEVANANPHDQDAFYALNCTKEQGYYALEGLAASGGETIFLFYTDSLVAGTYEYNGTYGDMFILNYKGQNEYVHNPSDLMSFTVTSTTNGFISGTFYGRLTPLIEQSYPNDIFGEPGSVAITNGVFKNVPVFY